MPTHDPHSSSDLAAWMTYAKTALHAAVSFHGAAGNTVSAAQFAAETADEMLKHHRERQLGTATLKERAKQKRASRA